MFNNQLSLTLKTVIKTKMQRLAKINLDMGVC